jgi:hypothetical protein
VNVPSTLAACVVLPDGASVPLQETPFAPPPLAVQLVAPIEDHVRVSEAPIMTEVGVTVSVADGALTVIAACADPVPWLGSILLQVIPKVYCPGSLTLLIVVPAGESTKLLAPAAPQTLPGPPPVSAQLSALVEDHVIVKF